MRIFKYSLEMRGSQTISLPKNAIIIDCEMQKDGLMIWAIVSPTNEHENRHFLIIPTGGNIFDIGSKTHIKTVHHNGFVWHVFEGKA